jgi:hypothetical protein
MIGIGENCSMLGKNLPQSSLFCRVLNVIEDVCLYISVISCSMEFLLTVEDTKNQSRVFIFVHSHQMSCNIPAHTSRYCSFSLTLCDKFGVTSSMEKLKFEFGLMGFPNSIPSLAYR